MGALVTDIADAVALELAGATLSQAMYPQRHYRPVFDLEDLKSLRVTVVPKGIVTESASRSSNQHDVAVDIAVQKRAAEKAELDALMLLVQEIADLLRLRRLSGYPAAIWQKTENVPVFSAEHLETKQVFTSVLTAHVPRGEMTDGSKGEDQLRCRQGEASCQGRHRQPGPCRSGDSSGRPALDQEEREGVCRRDPAAHAQGAHAQRHQVRREQGVQSVVIGPDYAVAADSGKAHEFGGHFRQEHYDTPAVHGTGAGEDQRPPARLLGRQS